MRVQVSGRHIDVGEALRNHVNDRLSLVAAKYFDSPIDGHVVFSREGSAFFSADIRVHIAANMAAESEATANEIYAAFEIAAERIDKRLRRYKRRMIERPVRPAPALDAGLPAQAYVLSGEMGDETGEASAEPLVIAETTTEIPTCTVSEAVFRLDLGAAPALMFRNRANGGYNVVFRRADGHIGWIDPAESADLRR